MADTIYLKDNLAGFVPQEVSYEILGRIIRGSAILRQSKIETMQADNKKFSVYGSNVGAYWVDEADRIGGAIPSWDFPVMQAKKLAVIIPITKEKINDSVINVFGEIGTMISEAFYKTIDAACIFGTNTPFSKNICGLATANSMTVTLGTNAKLDLDISDVMAKVEAENETVTGFIAGVGFKNRLRKLRDSNGNPLYFEGAIDRNGNRYNTLYGLPIDFCGNGGWDDTQALCVAGDWNYSVVGIRENIGYEILKEATLQNVTMPDGKPLSLAENDMIGIKATMRLGFIPAKAKGFAVLIP